MMKLFVFFSNEFSFQGSLILNESSQMRGIPMKIRGNPKWMKILLKSFYQMGKADQLEFMTLRNKWVNIPDYKNYKESIDKCIEEDKKPVVICKIGIDSLTATPYYLIPSYWNLINHY